MKLQLHRTMLFTAFLFTCPRLMFSQQPVGQSKSAPNQAESSTKELKSPEEALEQLYRRVAAIHREMAVIKDSDPEPVRDLKRQYARIAEQEEQAAVAAKAMAASHAQLAAWISQAWISRSTQLRKHANYVDRK
jgi:hypothetical protein